MIVDAQVIISTNEVHYKTSTIRLRRVDYSWLLVRRRGRLRAEVRRRVLHEDRVTHVTDFRRTQVGSTVHVLTHTVRAEHFTAVPAVMLKTKQSQLNTNLKTRKSYGVNARGIPPAAYQAYQVLSSGGGRGYPTSGLGTPLWTGGYPIPGQGTSPIPSGPSREPPPLPCGQTNWNYYLPPPFGCGR